MELRKRAPRDPPGVITYRGNNTTFTCDDSAVEGSNLVVHGSRNTIKGANITVHGDYNVISGQNIAVYGNFNILQGSNPRAFGDFNEVSGANASASGNYNKVDGANGSATGKHNYVNSILAFMWKKAKKKREKAMKSGTGSSEEDEVGQGETISGKKDGSEKEEKKADIQHEPDPRPRTPTSAAEPAEVKDPSADGEMKEGYDRDPYA